MIVGLTGKKRSGKDTAASVLVELGWSKVAFADPMRWGLEAVNPVVEACVVGEDDDWDVGVVRYNDAVSKLGYDRAKEEYPEIRRLLQKIGTEFGRDVLGSYLGNPWLQIGRMRLFSAQMEDRDVVLTDVRFNDEAAMIRGEGGIVVEVVRESADAAVDSHVSEEGVRRDLIHYTLVNDGTIEELREKVVALVQSHRKDSTMQSVLKPGDEGYVADLDLKAMNFAALDVTDGHVADLILNLYEEYVLAQADSKFSYQEIYKLTGILVEIGKHCIDVFESPADHLNAIVADLESLYDRFIRPLDIPMIPNIVEGFADDQIKALIRPAVEALLANKTN